MRFHLCLLADDIFARGKMRSTSSQEKKRSTSKDHFKVKAEGRKLKRFFVRSHATGVVARNLPFVSLRTPTMIRSFKALNGFTIRATDGHFGAVTDLYFDDSDWRIRYCVVDTGRWFASRYVLIGSRTLSVLDAARRELWVRLSTAQVRSSPNAGWGSTVLAPDRHLRSCQAVIGHRLDANDGRIGHVEDLLIDDKGWVVHELVAVPSSRSLPEKARVLISPNRVSAISWANATVSVDLPQAGVVEPPIFEAAPSAPSMPN